MPRARATPERLSAFSDGVFAVLITVLVLELRPPELPTFKALLLLWPTWLSYAVSYLFIAIVWTNHHHLMRYATEATPRLLWFNFRASVFCVPASALHRMDGRKRIGATAGCLLCGGILPGERDLHISDLGAYRSRSGRRRATQGAQDHACPIDRNLVPFRGSCCCSAQISPCWTWNLLLLPNRLSEARGTGRGKPDTPSR